MILNYIIQGVLLLSYLIVFIFQYNQVKHLKEKLNTLEKFQSIFDVDKFEGYIKLLENEFDRKLEHAHTARIDNAIKASIDVATQNLPKNAESQLLELLQFTATILSPFEQEKREIFIGKLPFNEVALRKFFLDQNKPKP